MKQFLFKILLIILFFFAVNVVYLLLVRNLDWNYKKFLESKEVVTNGYDILVLGNSLAMDGVNTELLGNAYNLAIGGASLETSLLQLSDYLERTSSAPSKVILCLGSNIGLKKEGIHPIVSYSYRSLPMLRFRWMAKEMIKKVVSDEHRKARLVQGQLRIGRVKKDNSKYASDVESKLHFNSYADIEQLSQMASICAENNVELTVIEMPGVRSGQDEIPVGPHFMKDYTLYNFNNKEFCKVFSSDEHWLGGSHLNQAGAEVFTEQLIKYLK